MPRFLWITSLGIVTAGLAGILYLVGSIWWRAGCEERMLSRALSPRGQFEATLVERICGDGLFITTVYKIVRLKEVANDRSTEDVVVTDWLGFGQGEPKIEWVDATRLEVEITQITEVHKLTVRDYGVDVALKYRPLVPVPTAGPSEKGPVSR